MPPSRFDGAFAPRKPPGLLHSPRVGCRTRMVQPPHADDRPDADPSHPQPLFRRSRVPVCTPVSAVRPTWRAIIEKGSSMSSKIYVGNLPYSVTHATLESNFAEFGGVASAKVMMDRETGRSKGFGFVEMASAEVAQAAIKALNGMSVDGRSIVVNLARPREESRGSDGYGTDGFRASTRADVGYGNGGYGGGRY